MHACICIQLAICSHVCLDMGDATSLLRCILHMVLHFTCKWAPNSGAGFVFPQNCSQSMMRQLARQYLAAGMAWPGQSHMTHMFLHCMPYLANVCAKVTHGAVHATSAGGCGV